MDEEIVWTKAKRANKTLLNALKTLAIMADKERIESDFLELVQIDLHTRELDAFFFQEFQDKYYELLALNTQPTLSMAQASNRRIFLEPMPDPQLLSDAELERTKLSRKIFILSAELNPYLCRISHLGKNTYALSGEQLPDSPNDPNFFEVYKRLVFEMKRSGELDAREQAYREYVQETVRLTEQGERYFRYTLETGQEEREASQQTEDCKPQYLDWYKHIEAVRRSADSYYSRLIAIGDQFRGKYQKSKSAGNHRSPVRGLTSLETVIHFKSDNINNGAVSFLSRAGQATPGEAFAYGLEHRYKDLVVTYGLPSGERADTLFALLAQSGAKMVKAHFALWGRWYEEGKAGRFLTISINQFCADLGYTPNKGAYRTEQKESAREILDAITSIEMQAIFTPPGRKPAQRMRGPIWSRGLILEETGQHADPSGQVSEGEVRSWEALNFSFAPGPWFSHEGWNYYNRAIGKIGAGLMQLKNDKDEWAILIGGYLATMLRTAQYQPRRLRVMTILNRTGRAQSQDARRRVAESQKKFEHAMTRLVEVGVLDRWQYTDSPVEELEDADDADAIAAYYAENNVLQTDFRRRVVEIICPFAEDAERLAEKTERRRKTR